MITSYCIYNRLFQVIRIHPRRSILSGDNTSCAHRNRFNDHYHILQIKRFYMIAYLVIVRFVIHFGSGNSMRKEHPVLPASHISER